MATKKKKWEGLKGNLPKWQGDDIDYIQKVQGVKTVLSEKSNKELTEILFTTKSQIEELKEQLSDANLTYDASQRLLAERFEADGTTSIKNELGTFYIQDEPYSQVVDKEAINIWIIQNGMDELRQPPWQTLNAIVKQRLENGEPVPPGVDVYMKTKVVMRRG